MHLTFWGTRGSTPAPGPDTVRFGGNTACVSIRLEHGPRLVLDAGTGIRALGDVLASEGEHDMTLLLSHGHWDHIQGFPFFAPAYDKDCQIRVLGCPFGTKRLQQILSDQMECTYFPVPLSALAAKLSFEEFCDDWEEIGSARIQAFPLRHPGGGRGFRIAEGKHVIVYLTDNELPPEGPEWDFYVQECRGADLLIHDAQYTEEELPLHCGWGHSSYVQATRLALAAQVKRLALFHHDPKRTDQELDAFEASCARMVAHKNSVLTVYVAAEGLSETF